MITPDNRPIVLGNVRLKVGQVWIARIDSNKDGAYEIVATNRQRRDVQLWDGCTSRGAARWYPASVLQGARRALRNVRGEA